MTALSDFQTAWSNLLANFWSGDQNGHILTQRQGYTSLAKAQEALAPQSVQQDVAGWNGGLPECWCQSQFVNLINRYYVLVPSTVLANRLVGNLNWLLTQFTQAQLSDASPNSMVVHASDDAAWLSLSMVETFNITKDQRALAIAKNVIESTYQYYTPPGGAQHGLYYAVPGYDNGQHVNVSTLYEVGIAIACVKLYNISVASGTPNQTYLDRAETTCNWIWNSAIHRTQPENWYCELHLDTLQPAVNYGGNFPVKGASDYYFGGVTGFSLLCALLYNTTGNSTYQTYAVRAAQAMVNNYQELDSELNHYIYMNDRDPWTECFFLPEFASTVLPLLPAGGLAQVLIQNTAASILAHCKTPDNYYTADWAPGTFWSNRGGSGIGMATAQQITTSSTTVAVLLANAVIG